MVSRPTRPDRDPFLLAVVWGLSLGINALVLGLLMLLHAPRPTQAAEDEFLAEIVIKDIQEQDTPEQRTVFRTEQEVWTPPRPDRPDEVPEQLPEALTEQQDDAPEDPRQAIAVPESLLDDTFAAPFEAAPRAPGGQGQTTFMGVPSGLGSKFVFVLDRSFSMEVNHKLDVAKRELLASLRRLPEEARFQVVFYNHQTDVLRINGRVGLVEATAGNIQAAWEAVQKVKPIGQTRPEPALLRALALGADVVYFLTDAEDIGDGVVEMVTERNRRNNQANIHAIALGYGAEEHDWVGSRRIRELSRRNRGRHRYINVRGFSQPAADRP